MGADKRPGRECAQAGGGGAHGEGWGVHMARDERHGWGPDGEWVVEHSEAGSAGPCRPRHGFASLCSEQRDALEEDFSGKKHRADLLIIF